MGIEIDKARKKAVRDKYNVLGNFSAISMSAGRRVISEMPQSPVATEVSHFQYRT